MRGTTMPTDQILAILAQAPPHIAELTAGLTPAQLRTAPGDGAWSANDLLAHLRSCADQWGEAMRTILSEDHPTIRAVNPTTWVLRTNYPELGFQTSFRAFTAQRTELVAALEPLQPADWHRSATVTGAGKALERTVLLYGQWLAHHERTHLKQFAQIATAILS